MSVVKLIQGGVYWTAHVDSQSEIEEDDDRCRAVSGLGRDSRAARGDDCRRAVPGGVRHVNRTEDQAIPVLKMERCIYSRLGRGAQRGDESFPFLV